MRIIRTEVYSFEELNKEAKETAIESVRNSSYIYNDFNYWAIDDCSLLEPADKELRELFGADYKFPLIENNRKISFSLDRDRHIDISNAMNITNEPQFLEWLGISFDEQVYFKIGVDTIEFEENYIDYEFTDKEEKVLEEAKEKFEEHCHDILNRIEAGIEWYFSDEYIKEHIKNNDLEFTEDGELI